MSTDHQISGSLPRETVRDQIGSGSTRVGSSRVAPGGNRAEPGSPRNPHEAGSRAVLSFDRLAASLEEAGRIPPRLTEEGMAERLAEMRVQLQRVREILKALAAAEGDRSLAHLVEVWKAEADVSSANADRFGTRMVLAERALRLLISGQKATPEVRAWQKATRDDIEEAS